MWGEVAGKRGGASVSEFFLLRIQISNNFCFFGGRGVGVVGGGVSGGGGGLE